MNIRATLMGSQKEFADDDNQKILICLQSSVRLFRTFIHSVFWLGVRAGRRADDALDRRYLTTIAVSYGGGPVGVDTLAAALSETRDAVEDIIEPFLIEEGFIQRTPRGRLLTARAFKHLGLPEPTRAAKEGSRDKTSRKLAI